MEIFETLKWIGVGFAGFGSLFGLSKLVEIYANWRVKKKERAIEDQQKQSEIHATNQGKQIETEAALRGRILDELTNRIIRLEEKYESLQEKHNSQVEQSAKITAENQILRDKESRQEKEIEILKKENQRQATEIVNLKNQLDKTQSDLDHYKREFDSLSAKVERMTKTDD